MAPVALSEPRSENLRVTLPSWTWAPGAQLGPAHLGGVDVDPVEAARVLDEEAAVLVVDAGVELRDRRLVERDVVVAGPPDRVGPRAQEADLLRQLAPDHLEDGDGQRVAAARAARRVERALRRALGAQHGQPSCRVAKHRQPGGVAGDGAHARACGGEPSRTAFPSDQIPRLPSGGDGASVRQAQVPAVLLAHGVGVAGHERRLEDLLDRGDELDLEVAADVVGDVLLDRLLVALGAGGPPSPPGGGRRAPSP